MRDAFAEIERGYEAKFKLDQELVFKAECRRNKMLGAWAAKNMGFTHAEGEAYARLLVSLNLDKAGADCILNRVCNDFRRRGVRKTEEDIKTAFTGFYREAFNSLAKDFPTALGFDHMPIGG